MTKATVRRLAAIALVSVLVGCSADNGEKSDSDSTSNKTLRVMYAGTRMVHLDPQRNYTGSELNFASSFLTRTLTSYARGPQPAGLNVVPDLATTLGKSSNQAKVWEYTLRDQVFFDDGKPITCQDIRYGVSRTFATDIITGGPTYALELLDIPASKKGSAYPGPYRATAAQQALFDKAITCSADQRTITFRLRRSFPEFPYVVALPAFSPVPQQRDTGEKYDIQPVSSGPYRIVTYTTGKTLVLERNHNWRREGDPHRPAYPDRVVVEFGLQKKTIDKRLMDSVGKDAAAVSALEIEQSNLATVFNKSDLAGRASNDLSAGVGFISLNTQRIPNVLHRRALLACAPRQALQKSSGGQFAGDLATGIVSPALGDQYRDTEVWSRMYGENIADNGNPELAKKLITQSKVRPPVITVDYGEDQYDPTGRRQVVILADAWRACGFEVKPTALNPQAYYATITNPKTQGAATLISWSGDWPSAQAVIPPLFKTGGPMNLSRWTDKNMEAAIVKAESTLSAESRNAQWLQIQRTIMQQALLVPLRYQRVQLLFGSNVLAKSNDGKPYNSPVFFGPNYADLDVKP